MTDLLLPLAGITVLDFAQFLAGPSAAMRLADLGATVIKVEPPAGENGRRLTFSGLMAGESSVLFQSINRGKSSVTANLKDPADLDAVKTLLRDADVMIQNARPGVIERLGLGYDVVRVINPRIVYASVSGYGPAEEWRDRPGQDLLAQSTAGLPWMNGSATAGPTPFGTDVADLMAGAHLAQGILACLVRRSVTGEGGRVDVSLLESVLDLVFENFTTWLNRGSGPERAPGMAANPDIAAPYGIYETHDGYLALSMIQLPLLGRLIGLPDLEKYDGPTDGFRYRAEVVELLTVHLRQQSTDHWLTILRAADAWCAPVLTWPELVREPAFEQGRFVQTIVLDDGTKLRTTRCPIRIDGAIITSSVPAPRLGARIGA